MGVGAGLYMYDVVVKSSRLLSHLLMSSCSFTVFVRLHVCLSVTLSAKATKFGSRDLVHGLSERDEIWHIDIPGLVGLHDFQDR